MHSFFIFIIACIKLTNKAYDEVVKGTSLWQVSHLYLISGDSRAH